jgi:membrane protein DedA with SNARE-associated domain
MLESITNTINSLGYVGIALLMALENIIPPIPSELIMPLAGFTVTQGKMNFFWVVIAGTFGSVIGATPWYFVAKFWGLERTKTIADHYGKWLIISGKDVQKAKDWFERKGDIATALGRLVPGIRTYISVPAGISKMPILPFFFYSTLGSIVWVTFLTALGYLLGANYKLVAIYLKPISVLVLLVIIALSIFWVMKRKRTSMRNKKR